jgi:5-methylcytosine-specific restriction protein A
VSVSFERVEIGRDYTRPQLAELWGYKGYAALARGIVTPRGDSCVILFITRHKQESLTQYTDQLENAVLDIEGESNHAADDRIIGAADRGDQIHLFYRDRHHAPFVYYGAVLLRNHVRHTHKPSQFTFFVPSEQQDDLLETEMATHGMAGRDFVPDVEGRKGLRQHVTYERSARNRRRALEVHGRKCVACGFDFDAVYGAKHARGYIEIHHVRSITKVQGPIDPHMDLVPLCSNCHSMAHRERNRILTVAEIQALLVERVDRAPS